MKNKLVLWACFYGLTSVIFGAFGAHALDDLLTDDALHSFETATRFQLFHSLLLLLVATSGFFSEKTVRRAGVFLTLGIFLFSFSIYALTLDDLLGVDWRFLAPITPIGGTSLIVAWAILMLRAIKKVCSKTR